MGLLVFHNHLAKSNCSSGWAIRTVKEMFMKYGWELNWRNDSHLLDGLSDCHVCAPGNFRCLQWESRPMTSVMRALHRHPRGHGIESCWRHVKFCGCAYETITEIVRQCGNHFLVLKLLYTVVGDLSCTLWIVLVNNEYFKCEDDFFSSYNNNVKNAVYSCWWSLSHTLDVVGKQCTFVLNFFSYFKL